jgi:hypothetical protein
VGKLPASLAAVAFAVLLAREATAEGTICAEGRLVETGQTAAHVLEHCGSPSHQQTYYVPTGVRFRYVVTRIDEWTYDLGSGWFPRLLIFENGVLRRIAILSR